MFKVVVGLGNPGSKYDGTRHNIGFSVLDALVHARINGCDEAEAEVRARSVAAPCLDGVFDIPGWSNRGAFFESSVRMGEHDIALIKPRTFMNRSGEPLREFLSFKKIPISEVVVVHDEIDLQVGHLRIKVGGGEGGHNGLRSISQMCGGKDYARVRVGVGKPPPGVPAFAGPEGIARWVLARYASDERAAVEGLLARSVGAIVALVRRGLGPTQNRYNQ